MKTNFKTICPTCGTELISSVQQNVNINGVDPESLKAAAAIILQIEESGCLDVDGIVRRWIPSQCLSIVHHAKSFHEHLKGRGYEYAWKVLVDEMGRQAKSYVNKDFDDLNDRSRWYNGQIAGLMAMHYVHELEKHMAGMKKHIFKGKGYIKLKCHFNKGKGVFLTEIHTLVYTITKAAKSIVNATTPVTLYMAVDQFNKKRQLIKWAPKAAPVEFFNAYKAAGAYYTMKDLIMFENCLMQVDKNGSTDPIPKFARKNKRQWADTQASLEALENKAAQVVTEGVGKKGYMMLGLLEDFLKYNKFDYQAVKEKWTEQSELRKIMRLVQRSQRRSRK